jgi:hypothetical protein
MRNIHTHVHFLPADRSIVRAFRTGISLHSHTEHSREGLRNMPRYLEHMPVIAQFYQREMKRYRDRTGALPDFSRAYWRGPLPARGAYELEQRQIAKLGLGAIVSLTDHDNIDAGMLLNSDPRPAPVPISVEWTVPYQESYFHLGIHNLPAAGSAAWLKTMAGYTQKPSPQGLRDLLEKLDADPSILIVFNHPLWDMAGVGCERALALIKDFLRTYAQRIHALEINGLRSRTENLRVAQMAQELGHTVVSGGDRHGFEANAVINLTRAATMAEFVNEIRSERCSDIAILPQYREPLILRHLRTAWDAAREHPELANREFWINRVYVRYEDGVDRPLSSILPNGAPAWINPCLNVVGLLGSQLLRAPFHLAPFRLAYSANWSLTS